eukprot:5313497-Pleurochrysis_carterae.AAC.1
MDCTPCSNKRPLLFATGGHRAPRPRRLFCVFKLESECPRAPPITNGLIAHDGECAMSEGNPGNGTHRAWNHQLDLLRFQSLALAITGKVVHEHQAHR